MQMVDIINSAGVSLILIAFFLLTLKYVTQDSKVYLLLNIVGAGLACYGAWMMGSIPFVVLEATWVVVSFIGLFKSSK